MRVKMRVTGIKHVTEPTPVSRDDGEPFGHTMLKTAEEITLGVVFEGLANKRWAELAPNGHMSLMLTHPEMFNELKQDQYFFVDLTPTDKDS